MTKIEKEPMNEELSRLVYEELIQEFPYYKSVPKPMAIDMIKLGVNNGIRFSDKENLRIKKKLSEAVYALEDIKSRGIGGRGAYEVACQALGRLEVKDV